MNDSRVLIQLWFLGALIGMAHCELVSCSAGIELDEKTNEHRIRIRMYVDDCAADHVIGDLQIVITEIVANFPDNYCLSEEEIIRLPNDLADQIHYPILLFRRPTRQAPFT